MLKIFFWNIFLRIRFNLKLKFKTKAIKYIIKPDKKKEGWNLTFEDDFENYKLNTDFWRTDNRFGMNINPKCIERDITPVNYLNPSLFNFNQTTIDINSIKLTKHHIFENEEFSIPYQVGQLDSSNYFMQNEGYFEIRSRIPEVSNMNVGAYLYSLLDPDAKISIYEYFTTKKIGFNLLINNISNKKYKKKRTKNIKHSLFNLSKYFYIYGCEWSEKYLKFYFQHELVSIIRTPKEFIHPMHFVIKNEIYDKDTIKSFSSSKHSIDYVRAYEKLNK